MAGVGAPHRRLRRAGREPRGAARLSSGPASVACDGGRPRGKIVPISSRAAIVLAAVAFGLVARRAGALTADDCVLWIQQLGGEVAGAEISGDRPEDVRKKIMQDVNAAQRSAREATENSDQQLKRVEKQAADLAEQGQLSRVEGERLKTLSETARRCLEQVKSGTP